MGQVFRAVAVVLTGPAAGSLGARVGGATAAGGGLGREEDRTGLAAVEGLGRETVGGWVVVGASDAAWGLGVALRG